MYQILIVEDEDEAARGLASLIERYGREHDAKFKVTRHRDASSFIKSKTSYDLVFMDIDLPGMSGMEAAGLMRAYDEETPLIFVTNLAQYAIRGYEVDALDFIVKPVSWYHFSMRMDKAIRAMRRHSATDRLKVSTRSGVRVIPTADVLYIDVSNHDLVYHICDEDEPLRVRGSLGKLEEELEGGPFLRISSGRLVNMDHVSSMRSGIVRLSNGEVLYASRARKREALDIFTDYLGGSI